MATAIKISDMRLAASGMRTYSCLHKLYRTQNMEVLNG